MKKNFLATIVAAGAILSGCSGEKAADNGKNKPGGGSSDESAKVTVGHLSGTAAVGAPLGLANVKVTCNGTGTKTGKTNIYGVYSVDVSSACPAPFHVKVSSSNGEVETIAVTAGAIANVTPLTQLISRRAVGSSDLVANLANVDALKMNNAQVAIKEALKTYAVAIKATASADTFLATDLLNGSFAANGSGIDKLLDLIKIEPDNGNYKILVGVTPVVVDLSSTVAITAPKPEEIEAAVTVATSNSTLLDGARAYAKDLTAAFKDGRPSELIFNEMMDEELLHSGKNRAALFESLDGSDVKGLQFRNVVILDSSLNNFWVSFQIFGIEDGSYALWNTWTSKVNLDGNEKKGTLVGNRLPVSLTPGFVRHNTIDAENKLTETTTSFRVLEIGGHEYIGRIKFKKFNDIDITGGTFKTKDGLIDPNDIRLINSLSSEFMKLNPDDAKKSISKITFGILDTNDLDSDPGVTHEAYIYTPQMGEENVGSYVTLKYPAFTKTPTDVNSNCQYSKQALPEFSDFVLSHKDFDLGGLEMNFKHYTVAGTGVDSFPGFAAYSWDQLTKENFDAKVADYVSKTTTAPNDKDYLEIGKFDIANTTVNDVNYHTIYSCL